MNWNDISYLNEGTPKQQAVYDITQSLKILDHLSEFDATLVSTICVGFDTEKSDLDFICQFDSPSHFETVVKSEYDQCQDFEFWTRDRDKVEIAVSFLFDSFVIEIFGSRVPVEKQNAWRHLTVMARLADLGGERFRMAVQTLKTTGLKTEPAIARLLSLAEDPFEAVLQLEEMTDTELLRLLK